MKNALRLIFSLIVMVFFILTASESQALHDLFKSLDLNEDGKVDRDEFSEDMKENAFHRLDTNHDNEISEEEWNSVANIPEIQKHREMFRQIDRDSDRRIKFFEFSDYAERHANIEEAFTGLDKDGSNSLSPDEISVRPLFKMITIHF